MKGCPGGSECEYKALLDQCQRLDHGYERELVRQCAALRLQVNELQDQVGKLRDHEEKRDDGRIVRKDRWEMAIREIAIAMGWKGPGETGDVVAACKKLIDDQKAYTDEKKG